MTRPTSSRSSRLSFTAPSFASPRNPCSRLCAAPPRYSHRTRVLPSASRILTGSGLAERHDKLQRSASAARHRLDHGRRPRLGRARRVSVNVTTRQNCDAAPQPIRVAWRPLHGRLRRLHGVCTEPHDADDRLPQRPLSARGPQRRGDCAFAVGVASHAAGDAAARGLHDGGGRQGRAAHGAGGAGLRQLHRPGRPGIMPQYVRRAITAQFCAILSPPLAPTGTRASSTRATRRSTST